MRKKRESMHGSFHHGLAVRPTSAHPANFSVAIAASALPAVKPQVIDYHLAIAETQITVRGIWKDTVQSIVGIIRAGHFSDHLKREDHAFRP